MGKIRKAKKIKQKQGNTDNKKIKLDFSAQPRLAAVQPWLLIGPRTQWTPGKQRVVWLPKMCDTEGCSL